MKRIIVLLMLFFSNPINAQLNSDLCLQNMVVLQKGIEHDSVSKQEVIIFWTCFEDSVSQSVEILEFRNELLFSLLQSYPELVIQTLNRQDPTVIANVCNDVSAPIHDGIDLYKVYYKLVTAKGQDEQIKNQLLNKLQLAIDQNTQDRK